MRYTRKRADMGKGSEAGLSEDQEVVAEARMRGAWGNMGEHGGREASWATKGGVGVILESCTLVCSPEPRYFKNGTPGLRLGRQGPFGTSQPFISLSHAYYRVRILPHSGGETKA